jgi:hypothetical protein
MGLAVFKDFVLIAFKFATAVAVAPTFLVAKPVPAFFVSLAHRWPLCKFSSVELTPQITTLH